MKRREFVRSSLVFAAATVPGFKAVRAFSAVATRPADVPALTGDGKRIALSAADLSDLASRVRGRVLLAKDEGYDVARRIRNPSFDKHPALIVQALGVEDVQAAVRFASGRALLLAIKCGGHSYSGKSTCDGGMLLDLSNFRDVRVDPRARIARVAGGTLLSQVDESAMAHGLVTSLGTVSHTGVGGLTLGGGFGRVARRYGLAIDNLESVDIVTADGTLRRASASENSDLFWGIRGGGGNFGVVTMFAFRLHPMTRHVVGGKILFPLERARDVLSLYADYGMSCPDELYFDPMVLLPSNGRPGVVTLDVCYCGPVERAEQVLAPIRKLGPAKDLVATVD